jgi:hypothetical protein
MTYKSLQKVKLEKMLQEKNQSFAEAFISHDKHTLFALEERGPPRTTYTCESLREPSPHRSGSPTDSPRRRRRKKEEGSHLHTNK